ncbi:SNF2-related protein, partial [Akkermansiaceae bacterium]|nr:SNF2-related protein [Akkermansiaceae bacterium]
MDFPDVFSTLPELCDFLLGEEWHRRFPAQYLDRGRRLHSDGQVSEEFSLSSSYHEFSASGKVQGTRRAPYRIHLSATQQGRSWTVWGRCTCPMVQDCKHVVAFIYALQDRIKESRSPSGGHAQWLNALAKVATEKPKSKKPSQPKRRTGALAYLVSLRSDGFLEVGFGKIAYPTGGRPPKVDNAGFTPNIRTRVPGYFQEGDEELTFAFQNRLPKAPGDDYYWSDVRILKGPLAGDLLPRLLETGRLFLDEEFQKTRHADFPESLSAGPPITLNPCWEMSPEGDCAPSIGLPSPDVSLIELDGPYYLDQAHHLIGPVELKQGQSLELLQLWKDGPVVAAEEAVELTTAMEERGIPVVLPRPVALEEVILDHDGPTPVLTFVRAEVLKSLTRQVFGGAVKVPAESLLLGQLSFDYAGRELSYSPDFPKTSRLAEKNRILVINRDAKAESKACKLLGNSDVLPIIEIFAKEIIKEGYEFSFGIDRMIEDWDLGWAHLLTEIIPDLEKLGWQIRYDSSFDLTVTEAAEVFTDLTEDPTKGIDWFQFDTGIVTTEGQRQSLMELVASFLRSGDDLPDDDELEDDQRVLVTDEFAKSFFNLPAKRFFRVVRSVRDLFNRPDDGIHRLEAAAIAEELALDESKTLADLRALGEQLKKQEPHKPVRLPSRIKADLRDYQKDGFQWLQFLARHHLHGILADDMGLGKTLQALTHLASEIQSKRNEGKPSLVVAPTSVVPNWAAEAQKFAPSLKVLVLHGSDRKDNFKKIDKSHLVITSYALLQRDKSEHTSHQYHLAMLDEAQYIKNPKAKVSIAACKLDARHRICLSGTPMENHLGELWSLSRFLMPGLLGNEATFNKAFRTPIERHGNTDAQRALNSRVGNLILRRTKDEVVLELPPKTEIIHRIALNKEQQEIYESVRTAMDSKVRDAIADKGLARSQIIVLDALLKLRQVCCHPNLIKTDLAKKAKHSAKLDFLVELLATLIEEGRRILLFSQFTTMLKMIEDHLKAKKINFVKITGATRDRKTPVEKFQSGKIPVFL